MPTVVTLSLPTSDIMVDENHGLVQVCAILSTTEITERSISIMFTTDNETGREYTSVSQL